MKKFLSIFLVVLTLVTAVIPAMAAETTSLATSSVDDDLKLYDSNYLTTYYVDYADTGIHLITMQEDGYSPNGKTSDYALYFYLYNPSQKQISASDYNKIQIANKWSYGEPTNYVKYNIDLVDISSNKRFLKVKLSGSKYPSSAFCCTNKDGSRSYSISGIDLYGQDTGVKTADVKDYSLAYTYTFSGYSTNGSLFSKRADLTTIELDVYQTSYLTGNSAKDTHELENGWYSNQVNSVYFSIPEELEELLGNLYAIDYEYYQYRTAPILVTDNQDTYDLLLPNQAKPLNGDNAIDMVQSLSFGDLLKEVSYGQVSQHLYYGYFWGPISSELPYDHYDEYPELGTVQEYFTALIKVADLTERNSILFGREALQTNFKNYAPYDEELGSYINYSGKYIGSQKYVGDLFDLDYFKENYVRREVFPENEFSLPSLADKLEDNGFFKKLKKYGWDVAFNTENYDNSLDNVKYIQKVTSSDISSDSQTASETLLVSVEDVGHLRNIVSSAKSNDEVVYLLRYAASDDYYYLPLSTDITGRYDNIAMVQQTVYLDFDIIELSFKDEKGNVTVIPVVSSPTDGFTGIENTTPKDPEVLKDIITNIITKPGADKGIRDWVKVLIGVVILAVGVYLFVKFGGVIMSALGKAAKATGDFVKRTSSNVYYSSQSRRNERRSKRKERNASRNTNVRNKYNTYKTYNTYNNYSSYRKKPYGRKRNYYRKRK